ncbi:MAG TPA: DUF2846 domain-containing protein [Gillisia sp.]|nr:DUF2846 domain-containing protein [Gillisia sp.]
MQKTIILLIALFISYFGQSQDIILTKSSNDSILAMVTEINEDNIKYKKHSNLDGPLYTVSKSEIEKIIFKNGDIEDFAAKENLDKPVAQATVYVIRPKSRSSFLNGMKIYEDEKIIGTLSSNTYLSWTIDADKGEVSIISKAEGSDVLRINPKAGKTYYIKQSHKTGWVKARPKIEFIDQIEAVKLLEKAKMVERSYAE